MNQKRSSFKRCWKKKGGETEAYKKYFIKNKEGSLCWQKK